MPENCRQTRRNRLRGVLAGLAAACLVAPVTALGQAQLILDRPRALDIFEPATGYADLATDRFGTVARPVANELGLYLLLRMFRNVCLGLEQGQKLAAVMPAGFAAHRSSRYLLGPDATPRGDTQVLSSTGDVALDEDNGHPAIWLEPGAGAITCKIEWRIGEDLSADRQQAMALFLADWVPYELSLVKASRPSMTAAPSPGDLLEFDRPCQGKWCALSINYLLGSGHVAIGTALNPATTGVLRP